jgi:hypothetical protein
MKMKRAIKLLTPLVFVIVYIVGFVQAQELYLKGDIVSLAGKKFTLDSFIKGRGIWKTEDGKSYMVETAKRLDKEKYILAEVEVNPDKSADK